MVFLFMQITHESYILWNITVPQNISVGFFPLNAYNIVRNNSKA